jgi:F-type H+-transporting ATPase subunit b
MRLATLPGLCALALLVALASAAPVLAADPHGGEGGGGILDKMAFTGIKRWDLGLYTLIVFGLLMFVLSKYAWPFIKAGLEKREANIIGALEQAKRERTEATELLARAKKELDETAQKIAAMLAQANRDAETLKAAKTEEGVKDAQSERDRAKREGEEKKAAMAKELQQQVVELAVLIATKALRQQVSIPNQTALLDESIAELKANGNRA